MKREFSIPVTMEAQISKALNNLGVEISDSKKIADCVLNLSDFFIHLGNHSTPWKEKWVQIAYLAYFLPLNFLRAQAVVVQGENRNFFAGLDHAIDFGAGPGTASLALNQIFTHENLHLIEWAEQAIQQSQFFGSFKYSKKFDAQILKNPKKTLAVFSYSLTELDAFPAWASDCEALMILEPATHEQGRKLQELRGTLIQKGFQAWAPCTHQEACPLLIHSKKDWCHDRIFFKAPKWFDQIEKHLPIKNKTITFSYLLARKTPPEKLEKTGRLVGDQLQEKGKDRQLFCRNDRREYLSWLHKMGPTPELYRGDLFELPKVIQEVSNEIRFPQD